MAGRNYDRLEIKPFGEQLLRSGDLDPIYIALTQLGLETYQTYRWLLAYWAFYSAGTACHLSEKRGDDFWAGMLTAAENKEPLPWVTPRPWSDPKVTPYAASERWPRGHERRHFRGPRCVDAVNKWRSTWETPENLVRMIAFGTGALRSDTAHFVDLKRRAKLVPMFGDWIAFKIGDMLDRCGVVHVEFAFDEAFYDSPRDAALLHHAREKERGDTEAFLCKDDKERIKWAVSDLSNHYARLGLKAPPFQDRDVDLQELETIFCKWKSHLNGHYPLWNDVREIREGVAPWVAHNATARDFLRCMPDEKVGF
jgi:hypothetical protein